MRFLTMLSGPMSGPPDPKHMADMKKNMDEAIQAGVMVATGPIGKRATSAARLTMTGGKITVEDPPKDPASGETWMASGGFSIVDVENKEKMIEEAKKVVAMVGDGAVLEFIQVIPAYPPPGAATGGNPLHKGVIPYLTIDGAAEAAEFYRQAFGAIEVARMFGEDGKRIMHCHLEINGGSMMLSDNFPEFGLPPVQRSHSDTMQLVVTDGDAWWNRAVKAGCKQLMPFAVAPWGDKYGLMLDPFGVRWALNEPAVPA